MIVDFTCVKTLKVFQNGEIDQIFTEYRDDLIAEFDKFISNNLKDDRVWASPISSRNTYLSQFLDDICRLILMARYIKAGKISRIVCFKYQRQFFLANGCCDRQCEFVVKGRNKSKLLFNFSVILKNVFLSWLFVKQRPKSELSVFLNCDVVDTVIYSNSFVSGRFVDRHFPNLKARKGHAQVYLARLYLAKFSDYVSLNRNINSDDGVYLKEQFFDISAYLKIIFRYLSASFYLSTFKVSRFLVQGLDLRPVLQFYYNFEGASVGSLEGYKSAVFFEMASCNEVRGKSYISWYENQEHDHLANLSLRKIELFKSTIGYRGFHSSYSCLNLFPLSVENRVGVLPKKHLVISEYIRKETLSTCPNLHIDVAPALRYSVINKLESPAKILVALPVNQHEALNILHLVCLMDFSALESFELVIKPHPATSQDWITSKLGGNADKLRVVYGSIDSQLGDARLLISSASSVCIQSIMIDTPVILVGDRNHITQNPMPSMLKCDGVVVIYDEYDFLFEITKFLENTDIGYLDRYQKQQLIAQDATQDVFYA